MSERDSRLYEWIGGRVRHYRRQSGITQQALSEQIGLTRTSIVNIEAGHQNATLDGLYRIADALSIDIADLLPPSEYTPKSSPRRFTFREQRRRVRNVVDDLIAARPPRDEGVSDG